MSEHYHDENDLKLMREMRKLAPDDFNAWVGAQNTPYILKEAALLYEAGTYRELDAMITVSAPLEVRIVRVMERDHISREQILDRMDKQWPDEKKIAMADHIIMNDDRHLLLPQVLQLHALFIGKTGQ